MTVFRLSLLAWLAGGVVGVLVSKKRPVLGFVGGALVVGSIADVTIDRSR